MSIHTFNAIWFAVTLPIVVDWTYRKIRRLRRGA